MPWMKEWSYAIGAAVVGVAFVLTLGGIYIVSQRLATLQAEQAKVQTASIDAVKAAEADRDKAIARVVQLEQALQVMQKATPPVPPCEPRLKAEKPRVTPVFPRESQLIH